MHRGRVAERIGRGFQLAQGERAPVGFEAPRFVEVVERGMEPHVVGPVSVGAGKFFDEFFVGHASSS